MNRIATALAILAVTMGAASAAPTAEEVLARAKAAQGGAAWDAVKSLRSAGQLMTGGLAGRFESVEDLHSGAWVDRFDLGAMRGANGFDGQSAWSQDASGMARVEGGEEMTTAAASEAYRRSRSFWFADRRPAEVTMIGERAEGDRRFHVLGIKPRAGRAFEMWLDAGSGLPDRVVQQEGPDLQTTFFSDYRELTGEAAGGVAGLKIAHTSRSGNGIGKYDTVTRIESVEVNPAVESQAFALPPPPRPDSGFEGGVRSATVPFELLNGHVYLQVKLNGHGPFRFLFDTGGLNVVVPALSQSLGLAASGALEGRGVGEASEDIAVARVARVEVGPAYLSDQPFFVLALQDIDRVEGVHIDGLVGYEVFRRFIVRFDYERQRITLTDPTAWQYTGDAAPVPFVFNEHIPQIDGSIDGIPGKFDIDTGSRSSIDLMVPFVGKHGLVERYKPAAEIITGWGVGGPSRGRVARAGELRLGPVAVQAPVVELSTAKRGSFASDFVAGNVGSGVLGRFNVTFDYPRQRIWFEPNRHARDVDTYDRAGLWVNVAGGSKQPAFEVVEVVPGGPAAQAGIRAGDRIIAVDGRGPRQIGLPAFRAMLKQQRPGTRVELRISREGGDRTVVLVLRDMV